MVVAEKFQAMVMPGFANSRMKAFYDIWFLAQNFEFEKERRPAGTLHGERRRLKSDQAAKVRKIRPAKGIKAALRR